MAVSIQMKKSDKKREANSRCYYNNHEYYSLQKRSYKQARNEAQKHEAQKHEAQK